MIQYCAYLGEVTEWLKVTVLKTVVRQRTEGSNPSLSATKKVEHLARLFSCCEGSLVSISHREQGYKTTVRTINNRLYWIQKAI
jgi:hypothetical protein